MNKQQLFRDMLIGTLLYSVVIGFFNDYTNVLSTRSYSITFTLAIVLQSLTYITLLIKDWVVNKSKAINGKKGKAVLALGVWAISFFSKFIFLWAIGIIFKDSVQLDGFLNILAVVLAMLLIQKLINIIDNKLGNSKPKNNYN